MISPQIIGAIASSFRAAAPGFSFDAFRARKSGNQSITGLTVTEVTFDTESFDTESAFASNRFTVPSALDGARMVITCGIFQSDDGTESEVRIQRSRDSGASWVDMAGNQYDASGSIDTPALVASTGIIEVDTGDVFRVVALFASGLSVTSDLQTFFSGYVVE